MTTHDLRRTAASVAASFGRSADELELEVLRLRPASDDELLAELLFPACEIVERVGGSVGEWLRRLRSAARGIE